MTLTLSVALHLVASPNNHLDVEGVKRIFIAISKIWAPAGIQFSLIGPDTVHVSEWPEWDKFLANFKTSQDGTIHGYYGCWDDPLGQVINGISCEPERVFWVRDHQSQQINTPPFPRVSSHELGHILGLSHYDDPKGYLMTSNDLGKAFQQFELAAAHRAARQILVV